MIPPDGNEGGSAAVAEPSTNSSPPPESGGDLSTDQLISNTFKTEFREKPAPQKNPPKKNEKPAPPKQEAKPAATAPEPKAEPRRASIFDTDEPPPVAQPAAVETSDAPEESIKENDWKAAHAVRNDLRKRVSATEQELNATKADLAKYRQLAADPTEIQRLKDEHKQFSDRVAIFDFQNHPDFKKQFAEPKQKLLGDAQAILSDHGIEGVNLNMLAGLPRPEYAKAMTEIESKVGSFDAGELRILMRDVQKLSVAEKAAVEKRGEIMQGLQQQSQVKMRTAFEDVQRGESIGVFAKKREIPSDASADDRQMLEQFNSGIDEVRSRAEKYAFGLSDERSAASVATKAANYDFFKEKAFPIMVAEHRRDQEMIAQLTTKLQALGAHKPGAKFDGAAPKADDTSDENLSINERVKRTYKT